MFSKADSSVIPNAAIKLAGGDNEFVLTDAVGAFEFSIPHEQAQLTFEISAIGYKGTIHFERMYLGIEKIYLDIAPMELKDFALVGLSAEDVVRKAVTSIPRNYADSSYFAYSSYREYEQVNGVYKNLVEAKPVVMFRLGTKAKEVWAKEAFAVLQFRKSNFFRYPSNAASDNGSLAELLTENPVYHVGESSLQTDNLSNCRFVFDTTVRSDDFYVINYSCRTSSAETHGISNYRSLTPPFLGESLERGVLTIDRTSFAFKRIERTAKKYPGYSYWGKPNLVYPDKKYFAEFVDGTLVAEYRPINGKWYLQELYHQYTNEYMRAAVGTKDYVITDFYEWRTDSVSRYIAEGLVDKFFYTMPSCIYSYDKNFWSVNNFPFFFSNKDSVYNDLERSGPIEGQFYRQSIKTQE